MNYKIHYPYITFTIQSPISIDDFFQSFHLSKKTIHLFKQNKEYTVNKRFVSSSTVLIKGDKLCIKAFQEDDGMYPPYYDDIDIIYEDDFLLIVNKPAFMHVYPDDQSKTDSLANRVSHYYMSQGYNIPVRFIHRLDYETSGMVIFCKCAFIQPLLDFQLSQKSIKREYIAVVDGTITNHKWHTIDQPIARDRHIQNKMRVAKQGKKAITHYQCLASTKNMSIIQVELETGRKHQIRVHLSSVCHPLVGDLLYNQPSSYINRQALHAYNLELIHPINQEKLVLICPPPKEMLSLMSMIDPQL